MVEVAPGVWLIDLQFAGRPGVIAAYLLVGGDGELALIETGPASTLETLWAGIATTGHDPKSLRRILVTHIHLDHAGAAGVLARRLPEARVLVHQAGARHLIDPSRLLASAARIYRHKMEELWGTTLPVPAEQVQVVEDGEEIVVPGHVLSALYTPGHARHHVAYHDRAAGALFAGDVGGVRLQGSTYVRPPTPPPDLDLAAWDASIERLASLDLRTLYLTHFGPCGGVPAHLAELHRRLHEWSEVIRAALAGGATPDAIARDLAAREDPAIRAQSSGDDVARAYDLASNYEMTVAGYCRYLGA
ncbi:MAG: MBL fold metallo-hydrolase [Chloroflexota bacterium]